MDKEKFQKMLDAAGLNKKEFAEISKIPYPTLRGWGSTTSFPPYLEFLIESYVKSRKFDKIKEIIKDEIAAEL